MSSDDRKKIKLKEFAELVNQPYQPSSGEKFNYIGLEHIEQQTLRINGIGNSSDVISQKHRFNAGDILFGKLRPYFRKVVRPSFDGVCSTDIWVVRAKPGFDQSFLFYFLANQSFIDACNSSSSGTRMPRADWNHLSETLWELPSLPEQKRIAEILSALDDKIELNRQTNATLEAIAQAIFKEWFVDFNYPGATGELVESELGPIPKGWRVGLLSEVLSSIESGSRPKGGVGDLSEGIPSIGAENINGLGIYDYSKEKFVSKEFFAKLKSGIVKSEDVLLYKDGASLGRKTMFMDNFPHQTCAINEHVFILRSNTLINQLFLYFWLDQSYMTENIKNINSNSAQPGINQPGVRSLPILIPEKEISQRFEQIVKPLLSKLFNNCKESNSLSHIRDVLLPKLMSEDINVSN